VTLVKWWMRHYDSATAKRHMGFANTPVISRLDKGKLSMSGFQKNPKLRTCEKYQDGSGKTRYKGTRFLKQTETLYTNLRVTENFETNFGYR